MSENRYSNISPVGLMETKVETKTPEKREAALVSWVMDRVKSWRDYRDQNYKDKWNEYYRLWRGVWVNDDKTRPSERSKLIVPALQQAIEATAAELEEAIIGKGRFFEVADDVYDEQRDQFGKTADQLYEDFRANKIPRALAEIFLTGSIYGTGIGKIIVEEVEKRYIDVEVLDEELGITSPVSKTEKVIVCRLDPIQPRQFVIDPVARSIDEALGCAHEVVKPVHEVIAKQKDGIYKDVSLGSWDTFEDVSALGEYKPTKNQEDTCFITEYHGLVPKNLLPAGYEEDVEDLGLVEAIITIANESVLLREVENPLLMKDRAFIAYQHDTVPNRFWGRGIAEKGYNPQKALDAELRARIDGLALTVHPMIAGDATRLPRGTNLTVSPGKQLLTNGDPNQVLRPFNFGTIDPNIFRNSADLERMIQMGTGAIDTATPTDINPRNNTASGMSMMMSGVIKRTKRTMQNIAESFIEPLVTKSLWRYMQFDPKRYPVADYKFVVTTTMGIMAREFEHSQMVQLLQTVPPESPMYLMLVRGIIETSAVSNKDEMLAIIEQMLAAAMQPQEPQPTFDEQVQMGKLEETRRNNMEKEEIERTRIRSNMIMDGMNRGDE